ncbi:cytochrome c oxidase assembly protein [Sulfitobacter pseudonitzschiae]|uniref:Cytochrome c oxidase assembly protein CtaG n=1 Tax=Pseudosulfitobacter pseudonitzschiae TaxID=1402135 RepID=A0A9Q2NRW8_9RHOB|nr:MULTISPECIES: cytochrome c oxidase assembly protein [Roseobacteraceae]MBM2291469.1 cytochrome c oxidase assembly protein [Pseudosulfitobacter pseudonitzschiae]MBM2296387.1 cytochrome c oxidase assembly protein [Pseudosulfitobacter pseudonitzschiae]MBM2301300.1 cytochrome c oxidase assembly protein [Pseudosulfitobacter pseudonitzschiae]MBM2311084.1 cytochrome c oxidase assembly protein [Pseudosulfitobacter pseudonitzschiae]MBM2315997.1 cytochrome c oxidase assembly protein [Pseudosulfitobact|tara:strand:- start:562 stop:1143 length:582 start_codon:yes stop_codon:yes gene_type:complete
MKRLQGPQRTVVQLVCVVLVMGGLSWASVPFYNWFCRVTGFGGTPGQVAEGVDHILDQEITVRFDASVDSAMPWEFKPVETKMKLRIGETALAFFEAYNPTDHPIAGSASYNVTPYSAGGFFNKIQCFCFEQQVLQPGERVQMPVTFFVDPEIVDDRDAKYVHTITLSYTFYEIDLPEGYAALDAESNDTNLN